MNFSKKEIEIFEGFSKLIDTNISINNIKVEDIAKSSGVGKGTVYSYFKSKEEVIAKSIVYNIIKEINFIVEKSDKENTFESKCMVAFEEIVRVVTSKYKYFQMLSASDGISKVLGYFNYEYDIKNMFSSYILGLIDMAIQQGIEENVINKNLDKDYIVSVFISVFSGISVRIRFFEDISEEEILKQRDISYNILIKALS